MQPLMAYHAPSTPPFCSPWDSPIHWVRLRFVLVRCVIGRDVVFSEANASQAYHQKMRVRTKAPKESDDPQFRTFYVGENFE
jgi:hypothetical protein